MFESLLFVFLTISEKLGVISLQIMLDATLGHTGDQHRALCYRLTGLGADQRKFPSAISFCSRPSHGGVSLIRKADLTHRFLVESRPAHVGQGCRVAGASPAHLLSGC